MADIKSLNGYMLKDEMARSQISSLQTSFDEHNHDNSYETKSDAAAKSAETNARLDAMDEVIGLKANVADFNESIISLSVDGTTVTYIKGDGSVHSFETLDTDTTYSLGTDQVSGLTKLYATVGYAEDGTMTQKAIMTELDKKVGVALNEAQNMLVVTV